MTLSLKEMMMANKHKPAFFHCFIHGRNFHSDETFLRHNLWRWVKKPYAGALEKTAQTIIRRATHIRRATILDHGVGK